MADREPVGQSRLAAQELRQHHRIEPGEPRVLPLLTKLGLITGWLEQACKRCADPVPDATKAAEWLLDNDYVVRRAIRQIETDLPRAFYRRLPKLAPPEYAGYPRVFLVAHDLLDAVQMQPSLQSVVAFVNAYQEDQELRIAELWALSTMLRIACLETLVVAFSELVPDLESPIAATAQNKYLATHDFTDCVSRALTALAALSKIPWKDFFDRSSLVEAALRTDPAQVYPRMDFESRDFYRKAVELLADGSGETETGIVGHAIEWSRMAGDDARRGHIGYWLVGGGRTKLAASTGYRTAWRHRILDNMKGHAGTYYFSALFLCSAAAMALPGFLFAAYGSSHIIWVIGLLLSLMPASIVGTTLTHWLVTQVLPPRLLPKLDFEDGLPPDIKAAVAVPVIFRTADEVGPQIERIETHWLINPYPGLKFVILSDVADAEAAEMPGDKAIEEKLRSGIAALNARYPDSRPFILLHRVRQYNPAENVWMGWERKRGKLQQFNEVLAGRDEAAFPLREGDVRGLRGTLFVITIDADTVLPPGSAHRLLGTIAHPLNRAEFDTQSGRVLSGYTFIQPRVEISPSSGSRSVFTRLYTGDTAIDIYSRAVSDVYQDLFGEGIFTGKGVYDAEAFRRALHQRVPENAILSHDLFEGLHGRAGLASDIVLYEDFPASYIGYARRLHRWVRGDWQLLPWLRGQVPGFGGVRPTSRFSILDRWKIIDNLRRSLIPVALLMLVAAGWLVLPGPAWIWSLLMVVAPGAYLFTDLITSLARGRRRGNVSGNLRVFLDHVGRWALAVVFMPAEAAVSADAITRTLWRVFVSNRSMLEWTTAAQVSADDTGGGERRRLWRAMWIAPSLAIAMTALLLAVEPEALPGAAVLLLLWFASPEIARLIGRPRRAEEPQLSPQDQLFLRGLARRTWLYFEMFAGPGDNWLPPDNFQAEPRPEIAHRTSPTNIGMFFLSALTARDFGYIGLQDFTIRIRSVLDTMGTLERHRGHLLNWYETGTLKALEPRYVSTVDSGNLAVSLLTLKEGCLEAMERPALHSSLWSGLAETLLQLSQAFARVQAAEGKAIRQMIAQLAERTAAVMDSPPAWSSALATANERDWPEIKRAIAEACKREPVETAIDVHEVEIWLDRVQHHLAMMRRDLEKFLPWQSLIENPPAGLAHAAEKVDATLGPQLAMPMAANGGTGIRQDLERLRASSSESGDLSWLTRLGVAIEDGLAAQNSLRQDILDLATRCEAMAIGMDFALLYDPDPRIFYIGYNVSADQLDPHHYDLLASEARLASYFAIAKRDVPTEHWFHLGRPITRADNEIAALSWNGSMFEYLMPTLLLRSEEGRLLGRSERAAVAVQRRYGERLGLPWGVSESGFALRDRAQNYQYQAFGIPGLGLRRELSGDYVVAPYASGLALAVAPAAAARNLRQLCDMGMRGTYGLFEAVDFTPARQKGEERFTPVRSFMAHHQGMMLAAIGNALNGNILPERFRRDRRMRAVELLLQERVPWNAPRELPRGVQSEVPQLQRGAPPPPLDAWIALVDAPPRSLFLGNGRMASRITTTGAGALSWHRQSLTRSMDGGLAEDLALCIYVGDADSGEIWRAGHSADSSARVIFHAHMAEFHQRIGDIGISMEVFMAPRDDIEIRRVTLANNSERPRRIAVTSYGEVVLARPEEHERHPAFNKMIIEGEYLPSERGLLFSRRPRRPRDRPPCVFHRIVAEDADLEHVAFETDRRAFVGRHGHAARPLGLVQGLAGTAGWTLDPVMVLQGSIRLAPGARSQVAFVTIAAGSPGALFDTARQYASNGALDWALQEAQRAAAHEANELSLSRDDLALANSLGSRLLAGECGSQSRRPDIGSVLDGQPRLWSMGLSGDLPILLMNLATDTHGEVVPKIVRIHQWWQRRGLASDLVMLRTDTSGYEEPMRQKLMSMMREAGVVEALGNAGGIHLHFADQIGEPARKMLESAACVVLDGNRETLAEAIEDKREEHEPVPRFVPVTGSPAEPVEALARPVGLVFDNGIGGFSADGSAYMIHLEARQQTPLPWCNVMANDGFGTIVSEAGGGFTWSVNSGEHRLTPWSNDTVIDTPGETLYLRDEKTAAIWTPTPQPCGSDATCRITHAQGYTRWQQNSHGLEQSLTVFIPADAPVKLAVLTLTNPGKQARRVTATYYAEWLLGALSSVSRPHVVCDYDAGSHALIARNGWNPEFGERVAFLTSSRQPHSLTCERRAFFGPDGRREAPAGLLAWDLGGKTRDLADPCAAYQVHVNIPPGATERVVFCLGDGRDRDHAVSLIAEWRQIERADAALTEIVALWNRRLGAVKAVTPDPAFDLMVNRWLIYQTMSCRILARSGFNQSGGAFGFRDQLQDMLAILHMEPARVRAHILECAARQFQEGDVLHWWHPPSGRGVRTRCSDDMMWLTYVTGKYVSATGDLSILKEDVKFLAAAPLRDDEDDRYAHYEPGTESASILDHCLKALERGVTSGAHGLPLIGGGDWNDGMDAVGRQGRGESVWLAWFAAAAADGFAGMAERVGRANIAQSWRSRAQQLRRAADEAGWDGEWYLRAFDDEGQPWGSAGNDECKIDSIAQSWSVLGAAQPGDRARQAMASLMDQLVDADQRLVRLLKPPFDKTARDPGYIRSYPPGVRENGGQYTHAAAWAGLAYAGLGDGDAAYKIFDFINPVRRAHTPEGAWHYGAEPYVVPGDVLAADPRTGQAGWVWYTGASGWTWRLGVEGILGLRLVDGKLAINPCLPRSWKKAEARLQQPQGSIHVRIDDPAGLGHGRVSISVEGEVWEGGPVPFPDDGGERQVVVTLQPMA